MNLPASSADPIRLDKWLWAARWFKTRALAAEACERGRVLVQGAAAKPSKALHIGDLLELQHERGRYSLEVLALTPQRRAASLAQNLYRETPQSRQAREREAERRRLSPEPEAARRGRPTKQDRRQLQHLRESGET